VLVLVICAQSVGRLDSQGSASIFRCWSSRDLYLQCVAVCCSVHIWQSNSGCWSLLDADLVICCKVSWLAATNCNTLQHAATPTAMAGWSLSISVHLYSITLQHTAIYCNTMQHPLQHTASIGWLDSPSNSVQHTTTHSTLQRTATATATQCISWLAEVRAFQPCLVDFLEKSALQSN